MRALCVAHDAVLIASLRNALVARGHGLEVAASLEEGLRDRALPDLIALDASLAGGDVAAWCRQVRATPGLGTAVVLIISCAEGLAAALEAGADDFYDTASGPHVLQMRLRVAERVIMKRSLLVNREARLRAIMESHLIGVVVVGPHGVFKEANDAFLGMTGYSREDLEAGRVTHAALTPRDWLETDLRAGEQLRSSGSTEFREKEYLRKDGSRVAVLAGGARLDERDIIGMVADISKRKQVETQLRGMTAFLDSVIDNVPLMIFVKDAQDLRFERLNRAGEELLGLRQEEILGKNDYDFFDEDQAAFFVAKDRETLRGKTVVNVEEEPIRTKRGEVWLHTRKTAILDEQGHPRHLLGISEDITERRELASALRHAREDLERRVALRTADLATANAELHREIEEREKLQAQLLQVQKLEGLGLLAGGIAHDFNNLLTAILGGASVALLTVPPENPARRDIETVVATAQRAANLTRQMLAYSGKGHVEIRPIELSAHVREIATLLETTIPKKVQLRLELQRDLPPIEADVAQVQQVIMNLVINGAEAIGESQGTVLVATGVQEVDEQYAASLFAAEGLASGSYVFLEVHDTGHGMDDATKNKIFDPFFTTKFTGRGLGLAAVLGIMRGHRGAIKVYSSPGKGTTFKVFFPSSRGRAVPARRTSALDYRGQGLVLVIDDDAGVRRTVCRMLSFLGFSAIQAADGREGVETFAGHVDEIVLVILDMTMPMMNGEETFREIRRVRADTPVILTSGYSEIEATRRFTAKGLAGFLEKPFTPSDLAAKLAKVVFPKK
ncbi:MAG TPA: PAS domain S-box protein [Thermoanaerobaculia bacterium]|nr:PAS domain S-box protein [Thermoanaerobaculia bacterium]